LVNPTKIGNFAPCKQVAMLLTLGNRCEHHCPHLIAALQLPFRQWELVCQWDLGGDGKQYFGHHPNEEWYVKLMRK